MHESVAKCTNCGSHDVRGADVSAAFWHEERLVVVEGIPALRCAQCGEQFYTDTAALGLDLLRGRGFGEEEATMHLRVPVFSFRGAFTAVEEES